MRTFHKEGLPVWQAAVALMKTLFIKWIAGLYFFAIARRFNSCLIESLARLIDLQKRNAQWPSRFFLKMLSNEQMSSIKASFILSSPFHVIFSLFSCPRLAQSGMLGIWLQKKTLKHQWFIKMTNRGAGRSLSHRTTVNISVELIFINCPLMFQ